MDYLYGQVHVLTQSFNVLCDSAFYVDKRYLTAESDSKHISCQMLKFQTSHLLMNKHNVSTIFSGPFQVQKAKEKCINLAKSMNYTHVGVMGGYCIHTKFHDNPDQHMYSEQSHAKCKDGIGNYDPTSTIQYMDVYKLTSTTSMGISVTYSIIILFLPMLTWL